MASNEHYLVAFEDGAENAGRAHVIGRVAGDPQRYLDALEKVRRTEIFEPYRIAAVRVVDWVNFDTYTQDFADWYRTGLLRLAEEIPVQEKTKECFEHVARNWSLQQFSNCRDRWGEILAARFRPAEEILAVIDAPVPVNGPAAATCAGCGTGFKNSDAVARMAPLCYMCDVLAPSPFPYEPVNVVSPELWLAALRRDLDESKYRSRDVLEQRLREPSVACGQCGALWDARAGKPWCIRPNCCPLCDMNSEPEFCNPINRACVERYFSYEQRAALGFC